MMDSTPGGGGDIESKNKHSKIECSHLEPNPKKTILWSELWDDDWCEKASDLESIEIKIDPLDTIHCSAPCTQQSTQITQASSLNPSAWSKSSQKGDNQRFVEVECANYVDSCTVERFIGDHPSSQTALTVVTSMKSDRVCCSRLADGDDQTHNPPQHLSNHHYRTVRCSICGLVMFSSNVVKHMWYHHPNELVGLLDRLKGKYEMASCFEKFFEKCQERSEEGSSAVAIMSKKEHDFDLVGECAGAAVYQNGSSLATTHHMTDLLRLADVYLIPQKNIPLYRHKYKEVTLRTHKTRAFSNRHKDAKPPISKATDVISTHSSTTTSNPSKSQSVVAINNSSAVSSVKTKTTSKNKSTYKSPSKMSPSVSNEWPEGALSDCAQSSNAPAGQSNENSRNLIEMGYISDESSTLSYDDANDTDYAEPLPRNSAAITASGNSNGHHNSKVKSVSKSKLDSRTKNRRKTAAATTTFSTSAKVEARVDCDSTTTKVSKIGTTVTTRGNAKVSDDEATVTGAGIEELGGEYSTSNNGAAAEFISNKTTHPSSVKNIANPIIPPTYTLSGRLIELRPSINSKDKVSYSKNDILSLNNLLKLPKLRKLLSNCKKSRLPFPKASKSLLRHHYRTTATGKMLSVSPQQSRVSNDLLLSVVLSNSCTHRMHTLSLAYWKISSLNVKRMRFRLEDNDNGHFYVTELLLKNSCRKRLNTSTSKKALRSSNRRENGGGVPSRYHTSYSSLIHSLKSIQNTEEQREKIKDFSLETDVNGLLPPAVACPQHLCDRDTRIAKEGTCCAASRDETQSDLLLSPDLATFIRGSFERVVRKKAQPLATSTPDKCNHNTPNASNATIDNNYAFSSVAAAAAAAHSSRCLFPNVENAKRPTASVNQSNRSTMVVDGRTPDPMATTYIDMNAGSSCDAVTLKNVSNLPNITTYGDLFSKAFVNNAYLNPNTAAAVAARQYAPSQLGNNCRNNLQGSNYKSSHIVSASSTNHNNATANKFANAALIEQQQMLVQLAKQCQPEPADNSYGSGFSNVDMASFNSDELTKATLLRMANHRQHQTVSKSHQNIANMQFNRGSVASGIGVTKQNSINYDTMSQQQYSAPNSYLQAQSFRLGTNSNGTKTNNMLEPDQSLNGYLSSGRNINPQQYQHGSLNNVVYAQKQQPAIKNNFHKQPNNMCYVRNSVNNQQASNDLNSLLTSDIIHRLSAKDLQVLKDYVSQNNPQIQPQSIPNTHNAQHAMSLQNIQNNLHQVTQNFVLKKDALDRNPTQKIFSASQQPIHQVQHQSQPINNNAYTRITSDGNGNFNRSIAQGVLANGSYVNNPAAILNKNINRNFANASGYDALAENKIVSTSNQRRSTHSTHHHQTNNRNKAHSTVVSVNIPCGNVLTSNSTINETSHPKPNQQFIDPNMQQHMANRIQQNQDYFNAHIKKSMSYIDNTNFAVPSQYFNTSLQPSFTNKTNFFNSQRQGGEFVQEQSLDRSIVPTTYTSNNASVSNSMNIGASTINNCGGVTNFSKSQFNSYSNIPSTTQTTAADQTAIKRNAIILNQLLQGCLLNQSQQRSNAAISLPNVNTGNFNNGYNTSTENSNIFKNSNSFSAANFRQQQQPLPNFQQIEQLNRIMRDSNTSNNPDNVQLSSLQQQSNHIQQHQRWLNQYQQQ